MGTKKDDFLILGFTGPFGSGCTQSARFFENKLRDQRNSLVSQKESVNANIVNLYRQRKTSEYCKNKDLAKEELMGLVRQRQIINSLEDIEAGPFYYISMTDMLNSLLVRDCLTAKNSGRYKKLPPGYEKLLNLVENIAKDLSIFGEDILLLTRGEAPDEQTDREKFLECYKKISQFRVKLADSYKSEMADFVDLMQRVGRNLRRTGQALDDFAPMVTDQYLSILSQQAGRLLKVEREFRKEQNSDDTRTYFVIECFRNPMEIEYFRVRYSQFFVFAIYSDEATRYKRLSDYYNLSDAQCRKIDKKDQGDDDVAKIYEQNIRRCVNLADISVTNQKQPHDLYEQLLKYFTLIKNPGCIKPTSSERNMNLAYSMSLNSTCICRQVGAVIVDNDGYIVGAGWNDTDWHRPGCMYRHISDVKNTDSESLPLCSDEDYQTFKDVILRDDKNLDFSFCYKDEYAEWKLRKSSEDEDKECSNEKTSIKPSKSLQQCRALHAEENAILQTARTGGQPLRNTALYTTTFPCELCAKKILQVGIKQLVYCEPYPKSVSQDVFFREGFSRIEITPFEGVKSPSFFRLFKPSMDIKDQQKIVMIVETDSSCTASAAKGEFSEMHNSSENVTASDPDGDD
jgi:deoxycytidylate deaminase